MAPTLPISVDHPDGGSDEELRQLNGAGPQPMVIFIDDESSDSDHSPAVAVLNDSSDDGEIPARSHEGYELLSQDPEHAASTAEPLHHEENSVESQNVIQSSENNETIPESNNSGSSSSSSSINGSSVVETSERKDSMDDEHIEKIKNVMKSVKLPPFNLPAWTEVVPEDEWKSVLMEKLNPVAKEDAAPSSNVLPDLLPKEECEITSNTED